MKKPLSILGASLLLAVTAVAQPTFGSYSFFSAGITNVLLQPVSTNIFGQTNIIYNVEMTNGVWDGTANSNLNAKAIISDVPLWANIDGTSLNANITVHTIGFDARATNAGVIFTFAAIPRYLMDSSVGGTRGAGTSAQNQFSVSMTPTGTNDILIATNLPTIILQGSSGLRLLSFAAPAVGTGNGTNLLIRSLSLNGFHP